MSDEEIGKWTRRAKTRWHLVESVIADRVVTSCGRQLHRQTNSGALLFNDEPNWQGVACLVCSEHGRLA